MRIISKFHDYYDIGMSYGQDEDLVWVRETEFINVDTKRLGVVDSWFQHYVLYTKQYRCDVVENYLLYCGSIIPSLVGKISKVGGGESDKVIGAFDVEDMRKYFSKVVGENVTNNPTYRYGWLPESPSNRQIWLNKSCHNLNTNYDCPIILVKKGQLIKCPNLKELGFQRIKDPYTVFQEISMYISGVMGQKQCPMVEVSDKSKIAKRGFDKWSFRKRPEGV